MSEWKKDFLPEDWERVNELFEESCDVGADLQEGGSLEANLKHLSKINKEIDSLHLKFKNSCNNEEGAKKDE